MGWKRKPRKPAEPKSDYAETEKSNVFFSAYYSQQLQLSPSDQLAFQTVLQEQLPVTFRLNPVYPGHERLLATLQSPQRLLELVGDTEIAPVPWYPNGLVWEVKTNRRTLKRDPAFKPFHNFLKQASDSGLITRQELVSMLPVLALDVQPGLHVLDLCAAPGSKTSQCIEQLRDSGLILANDADPNRARMLIHQLRRANTSLVAVVNHQAQFFPRIGPKSAPFLFDRILCDVPCTGDGAIRKYPTKWRSWNERDAFNIHSVQLDILQRALALCKPGGLVVYSTCSLNPIEDEAVVAAALQRCAAEVELVDLVERFAGTCPGLVLRPGLATWKVLVRDQDSFREMSLTEASDLGLKPTCFPAAPTDMLARTVRIMPQDQNTGGFYIALFRKLHVAEVAEPQVSYSRSSKRPDFQPLSAVSEEWRALQTCYGLPDTVPFSQFFFLSAEQRSKVFFISAALADLLNFDSENRLALLSLGVRVFSKNKDKGSQTDCAFRLSQEGLPFLSPLISARRFESNDLTFLQCLLSKRNIALEETGELSRVLAEVTGYFVVRFTCLAFAEELVLLRHQGGWISSMASDEHTAGLQLVHELV